MLETIYIHLDEYTVHVHANIEQVDSMLPYICSVTDHRLHQIVVKTMKVHH